HLLQPAAVPLEQVSQRPTVPDEGAAQKEVGIVRVVRHRLPSLNVSGLAGRWNTAPDRDFPGSSSGRGAGPPDLPRRSKNNRRPPPAGQGITASLCWGAARTGFRNRAPHGVARGSSTRTSRGEALAPLPQLLAEPTAAAYLVVPADPGVG